MMSSLDTWKSCSCEDLLCEEYCADMGPGGRGHMDSSLRPGLYSYQQRRDMYGREKISEGALVKWHDSQPLPHFCEM